MQPNNDILGLHKTTNCWCGHPDPGSSEFRPPFPPIEAEPAVDTLDSFADRLDRAMQDHIFSDKGWPHRRGGFMPADGPEDVNGCDDNCSTDIARRFLALNSESRDGNIPDYAATCPDCGHYQNRHSSGGMCAGNDGQTECYCVRIPPMDDANEAVTTRKQSSRDWSVHPGEVVREAIDESGDSMRAMAVRLGIAPSFLSDICSGKRAVGPRMALRIEKAGLGSAEMWVRMQADHDLAVARSESPVEKVVDGG